MTAVLDSNNKEIILDENSTDMNVGVSVSAYIDFYRGMIGKYQISSYQYSTVTDLIKISVDYQLVFSFEGNIGKYIEVKDVQSVSDSQYLKENTSAEKQTFVYTKNYDNSDQDGNDSFSKNDSIKYSVDFKWINNHFPTDQKTFTQMITDIKDETNPSKIVITANVLDAKSL
ncbi:MAG: hypothetical protein WCR56_05335 [Bacilli bacterium]